MTKIRMDVDEVFSQFDIVGCEVYQRMFNNYRGTEREYNLETCTKFLGIVCQVDKTNPKEYKISTGKYPHGGHNYFCGEVTYDDSFGGLYWGEGSEWLILLGECGTCKHDCKRNEKCEFFEERGE